MLESLRLVETTKLAKEKTQTQEQRKKTKYGSSS